jgi:hypothetical protein
MENNNDEVRKRGRPKKYELDSKRRNKETMKELRDIGYFKKYYLDRNEKLECPICKRETSQSCLKQHQCSKYCKSIAEKAKIDEQQKNNKIIIVIYCRENGSLVHNLSFSSDIVD